MAGDYILPEETVGAAPTRLEKVLRVIIVIAILCLAGELIWLLGIGPFRPLSRIDISGGETRISGAAVNLTYYGLARDDILAVAGITGKTSYFTADVKAIENSLMGLSQLESVRVFKHFPGRLQIILEGRRAVAAALASMGGNTVPVLIDSNGVVFKIGADETDGAFSTPLPVVSGLVIENPFPGMRLTALFTPLFVELERIKIAAPELLEAVSELRINRKAYDGYDLILYPVHRKIKVLLSELNEDLLRYTLLMLDVLSARGDVIDTLDFRSGIASYIPKEAHSE